MEYHTERQKFYAEEETRLLKEKKDIKRAIEDVDKRQEQWFVQSKETFDFACSAQYQFATGDAQTKTYIFSKLGSNLTIRDKMLHISGEKPYFLIGKGKKEIASTVASLEPAKQAEIVSNLLAFEPVCQAWRRRWDSNPRVLAHTCFPSRQNGPLSDSSGVCLLYQGVS